MDEARRFYDEGAARYVEGIGTTIGPPAETEADAALLARFVRLVAEHPVARVVDVGCGPGRAAAFVYDAGAGIEVLGVDLSLGLLREGRRAHPSVPFAQGSLAALPLRTASVGGVVAWYSIIHTAPDGLASIARELARVATAGGHVLVAFQAGDGRALDRPAPTYRHDPAAVVDALAAAGIDVVDRIERPAELAHESTPQAFILARRASPSGASGTTR